MTEQRFLSSLSVVRRHFKNWPSILADYGRGKSPESFVLSDGRVLNFTKTEKRFEFVSFARLLDAGWTVEWYDDEFMKLKGVLTMKIRYREPQEVFAMKEVFLDQIYACECVGKNVLDVGMGNGNSSLYFAWKGAEHVTGLEPSPDSYALAKENIQLNDMGGKIEPLNAALGASAGRGKLSLVTSRVETSGKDEEGGPGVEVTMMSFDEVAFNRNIDVVKMDCEGCEYPVIENMREESLQGISELVLEFHDRGPARLVEKLRASGFDVAYRGDQTGMLRAKRKAPNGK